MREITISAEREYTVQFVDGALKKISDETADRQVCVIVSKNVLRVIGSLPEAWNTVIVPDGEEQKSGATFLHCLEEMSRLGLNRAAVVIGIGGGATTDLAGFVAASYMRGIEWIAVPTSLAAMVDAAVGGKTGINLASGKNLAGAFHSPSAVMIDTAFLNSLPERDLVAGMAEVAKCGFIADTEILTLIKQGWRTNLAELIYRSIKVKGDVVSTDFRESFAREALNYGHTLGHAIEKHSKYSLRHGECVAIGLVFAAELSALKSGLSEQGVQEHYAILEHCGLPTEYSGVAWESLLELMQKDKKKGKLGLRFVTLSEIGVVTRCEDVTAEELKELFLSKVGR